MIFCPVGLYRITPACAGNSIFYSPFRYLMWITPACAGNRSPATGMACASEDHPRVCGEQKKSFSKNARAKGSPPRVRGTAQAIVVMQYSFRITPACAGNSFLRFYDKVEHEDHPRVCGEQGGLFMRRDTGEGSPPRVRGTGRPPVNTSYHKRITPACAGNSAMQAFADKVDRDHPRVCGEQSAPS